MQRYNQFSQELKRVFGCRVQRLSVDAGFTCPNRDGSVGTKGCVFCGGKGSGSYGILHGASVAEQLEHAKEVMVRKYKAARFIAYFQSYSNTYAPVERLRALYDEALGVPDVVGLIVGTRPDCLPSETISVLPVFSAATAVSGLTKFGVMTGSPPEASLKPGAHRVKSFSPSGANAAPGFS